MTADGHGRSLVVPRKVLSYPPDLWNPWKRRVSFGRTMPMAARAASRGHYRRVIGRSLELIAKLMAVS
jgi:hypothetical protein